MYLRKALTINVYITIIYIYYSVYRSREILQITIITICQRCVNDFITIL